MKVSKMHFAEELARRGNRVFFINPPRTLNSGAAILTEKTRDNPNMTIIHPCERRYRILLREKLFFLYTLLETKYIRAIKRITGDIDEIWNFNPLFITNTSGFAADRSLLFVYDKFASSSVRVAAARSTMVFSVAQKILDSLSVDSDRAYLLNHGLAVAFEKEIRQPIPWRQLTQRIKIGYIGNLFHPGLARAEFKKIVANHCEVEFHVWGATNYSENNLSTDAANSEISGFVEMMKKHKNVILHGPKEPGILAQEIQAMDGFLLIYSLGSQLNSHKIMEYMSTGKAIFSTAVEQYSDTELLVQNLNDDISFADFFNEEILKLEQHNILEKQRSRIAFALQNTYANQVDRIFSLCEK